MSSSFVFTLFNWDKSLPAKTNRAPSLFFDVARDQEHRGVLDTSNKLRIEKENANAEARNCMLFEWNQWMKSLETKPSHLIMKQLCNTKNSRTRARGNMLKTDTDSMISNMLFYENQFNNTRQGP
jgi:hypothetical protein